jgi:hypothetical protein
MVRRVLAFTSFLLLPLLGHAQEVHKCVSADGVTYQGLPCAGEEAPIPASAATATQTTRPSGAGAPPECGPRPLSPPRLPWRQATICIGMTDDEVLNLPGWGRPARIVRTREQRRWHEDWTYDARLDGRRHLHFINGTLAAAETEVAEPPGGSLASLVSN